MEKESLNQNQTKENQIIRGTEYFVSQKQIKDNINNINGFFLFGKIEGIDFTVAGVGDKGAWGHSLKLKFSQGMPIMKNLGGQKVEIFTFRSQTIQIQADTKEELLDLVTNYQSKVGQTVCIELNVLDGAKFTTHSLHSF